MSKRSYIWSIIIIISILCGFLTIPAYNYYALPSEQKIYACQLKSDDTLRIAMIGDSWVFYHYPYNDTLEKLISQKTGKPVKVSAYGLCGKTSKEIYLSFYEDQTMQDLLKQGADYCFISVGINDTYKKMGAQYYSRSTAFILRFLIHNNIKPILLEIPDYDIKYAYEHQTLDRKLLRQLSMIITRSELDCRQEYRKALIHELQLSGIQVSNILLKFPYSPEYYESDRMHLKENGYQVLDSFIADKVQEQAKIKTKIHF